MAFELNGDYMKQRLDLDSEDTNQADLFFSRGLHFAQTGLHDRAAKEFEEAAWRDPDNAEVQYNLGTAYTLLGSLEQAVRNFDAAIRLNPDHRDAFANRAVAYAAMGDTGRSESDSKEALRLGANRQGLAAALEYVGSIRKKKNELR